MEKILSLEEVRSVLHSRELLHTCSGPVSDNQLHWKNECPKKRQGQHDKASSAVIVAENGTNSEEDVALVADGHTYYTDVWIMDSGASYHICPRRDLFSTYEQLDGDNISMANSSVCKVVVIGSIKIWTHDGRFYTLNAVRHVPHMTKNLISLSLLDKKGFSFNGECGVIHVCKCSNMIMKGVKRGTLYFLQGTTLLDSAVVAYSEVDQEDMTKLWHMRLGHMSERGMQILATDDLLCGHKIKDLGFCEHCVFGKLHHNKISKAIHRTKGTLDYIHSNCWSPSHVESLGAHKYFLSLIDDYSRMTWVFIIVEAKNGGVFTSATKVLRLPICQSTSTCREGYRVFFNFPTVTPSYNLQTQPGGMPRKGLRCLS
ncbi:hypothetical protein LIER_37939 [Lithospermum erythrorhizon]|uniref:GAG-pre-integrase domain-containing protein n=1 Tax=Lithospermum erythrorhizon TaxID=34254 RepID=A0AAV3PTR6_LITER